MIDLKRQRSMFDGSLDKRYFITYCIVRDQP